MNRKTGKTFPTQNEIDEVIKQISSLEFLLCLRFADTLIRYIEITQKRSPVLRLHAHVLHVLVLQGGCLTSTQLAKMTFRSKDGMTKIVDSLQKKGFIVREPSNKDRRVTQIRITPAGLDYVANFSKYNKVTDQVLESLDITEKKLLVNLTERIRKKMSKLLNSME